MRIQILPLPSVVVGDDVEEPFALVIDQWETDADASDATRTMRAMAWQQFREECGARALIATSETVEVVDRYAETPEGSDTERDVAALADFLVGSYDVPRDVFGVRHTPVRVAVSLMLLHAMFGDVDEVKAAFAKSLPALREQAP